MEGAENLNRFAMHSLRELNDLAVARRQILAAARVSARVAARDLGKDVAFRGRNCAGPDLRW